MSHSSLTGDRTVLYSTPVTVWQAIILGDDYISFSTPACDVNVGGVTSSKGGGEKAWVWCGGVASAVRGLLGRGTATLKVDADLDIRDIDPY